MYAGGDIDPHRADRRVEAGRRQRNDLFAELVCGDHICWYLLQRCEAVTRLQNGSEILKFYEIEETTAACIYHKGSYADFPQTYAVLLKYIEDNGYGITGNIRESYIDGVWNKDDESEWLSEIQIPVRKKE